MDAGQPFSRRKPHQTNYRWDRLHGRSCREQLASQRNRCKSAAGKMGYPYGPVFELLILTGQRELEIADMSWAEVDDPKEPSLLTIPARRMKGRKTHEVPLTPGAIDIFRSLPRWTDGNFIFTTTNGLKPINGFSKAKLRIDKLSGVAGWTIQDIRRTVRTRFSALPIEEKVRELTIAHVKKGLDKNYDHHDYRDEKRHCLELWEKRLLAIVNQPIRFGTI